MPENTKILVVDDEPVVAESAKKILQAEGYHVDTASDAENALQKLRLTAPEIILIDLKLPGLSGRELLHLVKTQGWCRAAIMMTGYSTIENAVESLQSGAFDFLPKPFTFEELLSAVQRANRFIALPPQAQRTRQPGSPHLYRLGLHAWATLNAEGTAQLGVTEIFQKTVGAIKQVKLPELGDQIQQGNLLARLVADDQLTHTAWAALSGQVLELNREAEKNPDLINSDPTGSGWLVRVMPVNLENELTSLAHWQL